MTVRDMHRYERMHIGLSYLRMKREFSFPFDPRFEHQKEDSRDFLYLKLNAVDQHAFHAQLLTMFNVTHIFVQNAKSLCNTVYPRMSEIQDHF